MTCYMRHLGWLFEALELPYEKDERRRVDEALKTAMDVPADTPCNQVWARYKQLAEDERLALVPKIRESLGT